MLLITGSVGSLLTKVDNSFDDNDSGRFLTWEASWGCFEAVIVDLVSWILGRERKVIVVGFAVTNSMRCGFVG